MAKKKGDDTVLYVGGGLALLWLLMSSKGTPAPASGTPAPASGDAAAQATVLAAANPSSAPPPAALSVDTSNTSGEYDSEGNPGTSGSATAVPAEDAQAAASLSTQQAINATQEAASVSATAASIAAQITAAGTPTWIPPTIGLSPALSVAKYTALSST